MAYLTDRKRVRGLGASGTGTEHHWSMTVSSVALLILLPLFLITFVPYLGQEHATVAAHFARPWPAVISGLTLVVGMTHFKNGARMMIEDYVHGLAREVTIICVSLFSYLLIAIGLYALIRLAL